jgi:hypothetical protein
MNNKSTTYAQHAQQPTRYFDEEKKPISRSRWITDQLLMTYASMSKPEPNPVVVATMAQDLASELSDEQLLRGLARLRKEREWVSVKAIIELSGAADEDGRPGVEAAWAMCPKTEDASVVWTAEMQEAFSVCRPLLMAGDEIGARMAFKEQYPAIVSRNRVNHVPVEWTVSLGWDKSDRVRALAEGVQKNRIRAQLAFGLLGGEQQDELLLQLPIAERKLLVGNVTQNTVMLTGLQKTIATLKDQVQMPEPLPIRKEPTDEERAAHAKRVREQAAQYKARAAGKFADEADGKDVR